MNGFPISCAGIDPIFQVGLKPMTAQSGWWVTDQANQVATGILTE